MSRILFAWEMGDNFGHLVACLRVAKVLRSRGHAVAFAVRDTRVAAELLTPAGFSFVQAPLIVRKGRPSRFPANFSEVLLNEGYADSRGLVGAVLAWRALLQLASPDVVVAEYAPTALLAAYSLDIAGVAMGNGFGIPPGISPLPSIRPWEDIPAVRLARADTLLKECIERALRLLGCQREASLAALYRAPMVCTFPELDPYGKRVTEDYIGPIFSLPEASEITWSGRSPQRILAYLREEMLGFSALIAALANSKAESLCVVPGMDAKRASRLSTSGLRMFTSPLALDGLLKQADILVTYGGSGIVGQALLAGVPLLIAPQFVEQQLNAGRAKALGAAIVIENQRSQDDFAQALSMLLDKSSFREGAVSFAKKYRSFCPEHSVERAASRIEQLGKQNTPCNRVANA